MVEEDNYNDYMVVVYKHPAFQIHIENDYKSVVLAEDVEFGELLLIEHAYAANAVICQTLLAHNEKLFNMYYPRKVHFAETADKYLLVKEKLAHNCFGLKDGQKMITFMITNLNHSCDPNCAVYLQEKYSMENTNIVFIELYAIRSLKKGTELTINYGPKTAHARDFECGCGKNLEERTKLFEITSKLAYSLSTKNNLRIRKMVYQYLENPLSRKILLNHYLATKGIFMSNNTISACTEEGINTINNIIHKYLGLQKEVNADGIVEEKINIHKISLFLKVINDNLLTR